MARTKFGYLHGHSGEDMDGTSTTFEWVEDFPQPEAEGDEVQMPGWFAMCEVEPEAGWVGPFETEEAAVRAATTEDGFMGWMYSLYDGVDPMGDWHGTNV